MTIVFNMDKELSNRGHMVCMLKAEHARLMKRTTLKTPKWFASAVDEPICPTCF